jgi:hypothetical protein
MGRLPEGGDICSEHGGMKMNWGWTLVSDRVLCMCKTLGLIPSTGRKRQLKHAKIILTIFYHMYMFNHAASQSHFRVYKYKEIWKREANGIQAFVCVGGGWIKTRSHYAVQADLEFFIFLP